MRKEQVCFVIGKKYMEWLKLLANEDEKSISTWVREVVEDAIVDAIEEKKEEEKEPSPPHPPIRKRSKKQRELISSSASSCVRARERILPANIEEVQAYADSRDASFPVDVQGFWDRYAANDWTFKNGQPIQDWHLAFHSWERGNAREWERRSRRVTDADIRWFEKHVRQGTRTKEDDSSLPY